MCLDLLFLFLFLVLFSTVPGLFLSMVNVKRRGIALMTWNVRGLGDKDKRNAMFKYFDKMKPQIICLQETHMCPDSVHLLYSRKYPIQFHSMHTSYSRGVSVMVSTDVSFECIQQRVDMEGKFIFLFCKLNGLVCIIASIYIPPPFSITPLRSLAQITALYPNVPVLALGDYNNTLDNSQDRMSLTPRVVRQTAGKTAFASLLLELGLHDVWRERHEKDRCYSCYSATHDIHDSPVLT